MLTVRQEQLNAPALLKGLNAYTVAIRSDGSYSWWGRETYLEMVENPFEGLQGRYKDLAETGNRACGLTLEGAVECSVEGSEAVTVATGPYDRMEMRGWDACGWTTNGPVECFHSEQGWAQDDDERLLDSGADVDISSIGVCWRDASSHIQCAYTDDQEHVSPDVAFESFSMNKGVGGLTADGQVESGDAGDPNDFWELTGTYTEFTANHGGYGLRTDGTIDSAFYDSWDYPSEEVFSSMLIAGHGVACGIKDDDSIHCWNPDDSRRVFYPSQDWPEIVWIE